MAWLRKSVVDGVNVRVSIVFSLFIFLLFVLLLRLMQCRHGAPSVLPPQFLRVDGPQYIPKAIENRVGGDFVVVVVTLVKSVSVNQGEGGEYENHLPAIET